MKRQCMPVKGLAISGIVILLFLAGCGGGTASTGGGSNPVPTITAISPTSAVAGSSAGFTLTINGTNFAAASMVNFGGTTPTTTFVSSTQLTAAIPVAAIASVGTAAVTVSNPAPGGGTSNAVNFTITNSLTPVIAGLDPSGAAVGGSAFTLRVVGGNFQSNSVVRWNAADRPTTFVTTNEVTAQIPAGDIATTGAATVTVFNLAPGVGSSNSVTFTIVPGNAFRAGQDMIKVSGVHTATLLPSGQALVAGGCGGQDYLEVGQPDAELYDPVTTSFTVTGSMEFPRCRHTATLLPNGKVLAVGGFGAAWDGPAAATNSTELYDPATGTFSHTDNMAQARAAHTATLLPNGKVLIAGGATIGGWGFPFYGSALVGAEIYDPATNTFTATGSMGTARFGHTATLLPSGKVLIAGGFTSTEVNQQALSLASAEVYDPATQTFNPAGDMAVTHGGHTATLLQDGRLLITGGFATAGPSTTVVSSAELYQPLTGVFTSAGNMMFAREEHTATLLTNGQVLIAGGATPNAVLATAELYDPTSGTFTGTYSMATPRTGHSATLLQDATVLVSGGDQSDGSVIPVYLRSAEIFMPLP